MKRSVWSCLALVTASAAALACGSSDEKGSPFGAGGPLGGGGGSLSGGSLAGGTTAGGGNPGGTGPGSCGSQTVNSGRITADILIVLDRSQSMKMQNVNRWDPSVRGIKSITSSLQDRVAFGLMTFPGPGARSGRTDEGASSCDPGQLRVPIQANDAAAIASTLDMTQPGGFTPTAVTLKAAREVIAPTNGGIDPDARVVPKYVLLVTDGAPNCFNNMVGSGSGTAGSSQPEAVEASLAEIKALTAAGVKTFVLGYDTKNDAALRATLDTLAAAGGTGEQQHRAIEDEQSLVAAFSEITQVAITCDFELENTVVDAKYVLVKIDGKQLNWKGDDGWVLGTDNKTVSLRGEACSTIKQEGHTLSISVECEPVPDLF